MNNSSKKILLRAEKRAIWYEGNPEPKMVHQPGFGMVPTLKAVEHGTVYITSNEIEIYDIGKIKKLKKEIKFEDINHYENYKKPSGQYDIYIKYSNNQEIGLQFQTEKGGFFSSQKFDKELHNKAFNLIKEQIISTKMNRLRNELIEYIKPYDEITFSKIANYFNVTTNIIESELKKILQDNKIKGRLISDRIILREAPSTVEQTVYLTIPPKTRLTALKCPNCQAPLDFMPPCKCEHCGVMIEITK
ncbi:MAG: PCI domain-containing protein [Candidatus Helarchaeota archaeon]|nr:PCI domain-containing protein [Candidatus Helarchaeota archaeon]